MSRKWTVKHLSLENVARQHVARAFFEWNENCDIFVVVEWCTRLRAIVYDVMTCSCVFAYYWAVATCQSTCMYWFHRQLFVCILNSSWIVCYRHEYIKVARNKSLNECVFSHTHVSIAAYCNESPFVDFHKNMGRLKNKFEWRKKWTLIAFYRPRFEFKRYLFENASFSVSAMTWCTLAMQIRCVKQRR